ncbi:MAG: hypothetical protein J7M10_03690, partial [Candidatus Cloacimonetes bacterium]|nr:hypothetical protein [Candidatus Cloacimonadota bacterium]
IIYLDQSKFWGAVLLSNKVKTLPEDSVIVSDYAAEYIESVTSRKVFAMPLYMDIGIDAVERSELIEIILDRDHPKHEMYTKKMKENKIVQYKNFDEDWLNENKIDYIILSIYGEWERKPNKTAFFNPIISGFKITQIKRPYSNGRVPPDYDFSSTLYTRIESDKNFKKIDELYKDKQRIFIIYEYNPQ